MHFPTWLTWYKKPEYRDIKEYSTAVGSGRRPLSPDGRNKTAIPSRLKLERVLENKTCSPMSLYDFYMYLKYIEFSPENLEFYIWYKNYEESWKKAGMAEKDDFSLHSSTESTSSLSKPGDGAHVTSFEVPPEFSVDEEVAEETLARITELIGSEAMCASGACKAPNFSQRPGSLVVAAPPPAIVTPGSSAPSTPTKQQRQQTKLTRATSTLNLVDSTSGRRAELNAVIKTFLIPGAEKELNIPPSMREQALSDLRHSADPAHLRPVADHVYLLLRNCSHRNFVRLGVSNGTFETVCMATGLGIVLTVAGFLCELLLALTPHVGARSRWLAVAPWPMWWLGVSLVLSGLRGSCFFLLLFSRRQPLPWERFDDGGSIDGGGGSVRSHRPYVLRLLSRLMIFDRKFKVKDPHLRRLQHRIVLQSLFFGALFATLGVLLFIFLPVWAQTVRR